MMSTSGRLCQYRGRWLAEHGLPYSRWRFHLCKPPYDCLKAIPSAQVINSTLSKQLEPCPGLILVQQPVVVDEERQCADVDQLRGCFPWLTLAVLAPEAHSRARLGALTTRLSRRGAVVVFPGENPAGSVTCAVRDTAEPQLQLRGWLRATLRGWSPHQKDDAVTRFNRGFNYDPERERRGQNLPRRQHSWTLAGRAMRAAVSLQRTDIMHSSLSRTALDAGYADARAMDRALLRSFGVPARQIRGTVGWEWLLWRFICGLGRGKTNPRGIKRALFAGFGP